MPLGTCPSCGASMKLLLVSFFCPNDCDRKSEEQVTVLHLARSGNWRVEKLKIDAPIPSWATRGWYLYPTASNPVENAGLDPNTWLIEAQEHWSMHIQPQPGWELKYEPRGARIKASHIMVMAKI